MSATLPITIDPRYRLTTATEGQTTFSVPFPFLGNDDIAVVRIRAGARTPLQLDADYTVSGAKAPGGGSIVLTVAAKAGDQILRFGNGLLNRTAGVNRGGRYSSASLDEDIDRLLIHAQENARDIGRSLKAAMGAPAIGDLPAPDAGRALIWNAAGDGFNNGPDADEITAAQAHALAAGVANEQGQAALAQTESLRDEAADLVQQATAGFVGFLEDQGYDFGSVTSAITYFDHDWGNLA